MKTTLHNQITERGLQETILHAAKLLGWLAYHTYDSRRSAEGFPDLVMVHPETGYVCFWELKSAAGKITTNQDAWLVALMSIPTVYVDTRIVRPCNLDHALSLLQRWSRKRETS